MIKNIGEHFVAFYKALGFWLVPKKSFPSRIYTVAMFLAFFLFYTTFKCSYFPMLKDLRETSFFTFVCLSEIALILKISTFLVRNESVRKNQSYLESFALYTPDEKRICASYMSQFKKIAFVYILLTNSTCILSFVVPLTIKEPTLCYLAWYPVDWQHERSYYWMVYIYQVVGMIFQANTVICLELYTVYMLIVTSAYLRVLDYRFRRIGFARGNSNQELIDGIKMHQWILV